MLFTHSPVLPLFSKRAYRCDMTRLHEKHPKILKIPELDEMQLQCFMQEANIFLMYSQFNESVNMSESNVRINTG